MYTLFILTAAICGVLAAPVFSETGPTAGFRASEQSLRVLWTVTEFKIATGAKWDEKKAAKMLFKSVNMDETSITFDGKTCEAVSFDCRQEDLWAYLDQIDDHARQLLNLPFDNAVIVRTNCCIRGFDEFVRLPDKRLLIRIKGVFFFLEPNINY